MTRREADDLILAWAIADVFVQSMPDSNAAQNQFAGASLRLWRIPLELKPQCVHQAIDWSLGDRRWDALREYARQIGAAE